MNLRTKVFQWLMVVTALFVFTNLGWSANPVRGGEFKASMHLEPVSLDPLYGNGTFSDRNAFNLFYENLLRLTDDGKYEPLLAESWSIAPDNKSITFKLRKGVVFHDGTAFNAEVAKWNLDRARDKSLNAAHSSDLADIASVDIIDSSTIRVNLVSPSASIMVMLAYEAGSMISPTAYKKLGKDFGRNPVGTGPYRFVKWISSDRVTGERFKDYWRIGADSKKLPYMDSVSLRFNPNTRIKITEVKSGNLHLADEIQVKDFSDVEADPNIKLVDKPHGMHQFLAFNVTKPPFNNKDLRLAVCHAINRDALMKVITRGYGSVTPTLVPSNWFIYTNDLPIHTYNPEKAKAYLKKSGVTGDFTCSIIQRDPDTQIAQLIQAQLKEVGINMTVEAMERKAWVAKVIAEDRKFHAGTLMTKVPAPDPDFVFGLYFGGKGKLNWSGVNDKALFDAVEMGAKVFDEQKRKEYYKRAQEVLLNEGYYAFLFNRPIKDVASKGVKNVRRDLNGAWYIGEMWVE